MPEVHRSASAAEPSDEGYVLEVGDGRIAISAKGISGVRYAMYTLRQMAEPVRGTRTVEGYEMPCCRVVDRPKLPFRGIHICWFSETPASFIEHVIRQAAYYKLNAVVIEGFGQFRSSRHPELNWPDGKMTYQEVARLRGIASDVGVTLIPQLNVFGHGTGSGVTDGRHCTLDLSPEFQPLFEPEGGWNWCLSNPYARETLWDLIEELHELFGNPPYFHIGCDEAQPPTCRNCAGVTNYHELVGQHIVSIAERLRKRGASTLMWHDMLLDKEDTKWKGFVANGGKWSESLLDSLPRDIIICDWHYGKTFEWGGVSCFDDYPTLRHFKSQGFRTVTCPWEDAVGAESQGKWAVANGLFGGLITTWNRNRGLFRYREFMAADVFWGNGSWFGQHVFSTHWRQTGWDMSVKDRSESGYCRDSCAVLEY